MNKVAVIILGSVPNKTKFIAAIEKKLQEFKNFDDNFVLIFSKKLEDADFFQSDLNWEPQLIDEETTDNIDLIFKVKLTLDRLDVLKCLFVVNSSSLQSYTEICKLLFPPAYDLMLHSSDHIQPFHPMSAKEDIEDNVRTYLSRISSTNSKPVALYHSKLIPAMFVHGYSSRQGGISSYKGLTSLNLSYSLKKRDSRMVVMENRSRLAHAAHFDSQSLHLAKAVHGNDIWVFEEEEPESYDGIISNTPNVVLAAPGADCNMLLFADPVSNSCGAVHAGWKGILCGAIQATVKAMVTKYGVNPSDLIVSIGPSLSACCCEFGAEQAKKFLSIDEKCVIWKPDSSKPFLDLRLAAKVLLQQSGVLLGNIDDGTGTGSDLLICTKCDPSERFFSFRRVGPQFGNQVGFIGLSA